MEDETSLDLSYNKEIKCPFCGCDQMDSWECGVGMSDGDEGITDCDSCGKKIKFRYEVEVTFTTLVPTEKP